MSLFSLRKSHVASHLFSYRISVIGAWVAGELIGYCVGSKIPNTVFPLMRMPAFGQVSIVWLFLFAIFPFLFSFIASRRCWLSLLKAFVFLKAYCFTYSVCCVGLAFGNAGWLMRFLCFFTDALCTLLLLWFILYFPASSKSQQHRRLLLCCVSVATLVCLDYFAIKPLFLMLLNR